ncbi:hypothetical protein TrRE_jg2619, partial [Triparma retinervis]
MSKDSKHFLELVIQKLCHCWRRKQALDLLRCFNMWARRTLEIDLKSAREIKSLRKEVKTANERVTVFVETLMDEDDDEDVENLTPQQAESLLRERWQKRVDLERATRKRNMKKMISLFKHKSLYRCYVNWKNYTQSQKNELALKLKSSSIFLHRLQNNDIAVRFSTWRSFWFERKKLRKFIKRFTGGRDHRMKDMAFRLLRKNWIAENAQDQQFESANKEELLEQVHALNAELTILKSQMGDILTEKRERAMKNMERYIATWKNQCLVKTFAAWDKFVQERLGQKRLLRKTIVRMLNAKIVSAFEEWKEQVGAVIRAEYLTKKVLTRLTNIKQASAFSRWKLQISRAKELEEKARAATTQTFAQMEEIIDALQRKVDQYEGTMGTNEELQGKVEMLESQLTLLQGQLGGAKAAAAEAAQKNAKKLIQNMINKSLTTTFMAWKSFASSGRENKIKVQRFLVKVHKAGLYRCWTSWLALHLEKKKHKLIVKKFVARMSNATAIKILQSWGSYSKERKRHKLVLKRFATRLRNSRALSAFASWIEYLNARRRLKYLAHKIMNRLENGKLFGAWLTWMSHFDAHREREEEIEKERLELERLEEEKKFLSAQEAKEMQAKEERARRFIQKVMNKALGDTLSAWKDFAAEQKRNKILIRRFLKKLLNKALASSYSSWIEYIDARRFLRNFMKRMLGGKRLNTLRFKMKQWREFTVEMRNLEMEHGSNSLHELVDSLSKKVQELEAQNKILTSSLGETKLAKMEAAKRNMKNKIQTMIMGALQTTFQGWTKYVAVTKEERTKVKRFLAKINNSTATKCFAAWASVINDNKRQAFIIKKVAARMQNGVLVRVINAWRGFAQNSVREKVMLARFAKRLKNSAMISSFASWQEWIGLRQRLRYLTQKIVNRITNSEVFAAFNLWSGFVEQQMKEERFRKELQFMGIQEREAAEQILKDKERRRQKALEAIQKSLHGALAKTFIALKNHAAERKVERVKIARFLTKLKNRAAVSALSTWVDYCENRRFLRGIINRFVFGKAVRLQSAAWRHWKDTHAGLKQLELEHGTVELEDLVAKLKADLERVVAQNELLMNNLGEVKRAKMEAAERNMKIKIQAWMNACLVKTFQGWVTFVKAEKEERTKLQRFVARIVNGTMVKVFGAWAQWAAESKRYATVVTRFKAKLQNGVVFRILMSWRAAVEEDKKNRVLVQRFGKRLMNSAMVGSFESWREFVWLRKRLKYLALKTFNRLANSQLFGAWEVWVEVIEKEKEKEKEQYEMQFLVGKEREEAERKLAEAERKRQKGLEMIQRMMNGTLATTLIAWKSGAALMKRERIMLERFAKKMKNRQAYSTMISWREFVGQRKWIRGLMVRMLGGKEKKALFAALRRWDKFILHMKELEIEHGVVDQSDLLEQLHHEVQQLKAQNAILANQLGEEQGRKNDAAMRSMERFIRSWQQKAILTTMFAWKSYTQECVGNRRKMVKFLAKLTMGVVGRIFGSWAEYYFEEKRNRNKIKKLRARIQHGFAIRCLEEWRTVVGEQKRYRVLVERFALRMKNRVAVGAFMSWQEFVFLRKRLRQLAFKMFNRLFNSRVFGAWEVWLAAVEAQRRKEDEEEEMRFLVGQEKEDAERRIAEKEKKRQKGLEMIQRMVNGALAETLIAWKAWVKQQKEDRVKMERFGRRLMMRAVVSSLASWRAFTRQRKWLRGLLVRLLGGKEKKAMFAAFRRWERVSAHLRVLMVEHGTSDQNDLLEMLHHRVEELEAQNTLLIGQLGEANYAKQEGARRAMERFVQSWRNKALVTTLMAWKSYAKDAREDKLRMVKFLARLQKGVVIRIFEAWAGLLKESRRNATLIKRVGARLTKGLLFRCFSAWTGWAAGEKKNRVIVERFAKRMKNQRLFGSWGSWMEYIWLRKRARKLGYKVFNRICNATLLGAWDHWCGEVDRQKAAEQEEYDSRHSTEEERKRYLAKREEAEKKREAGLRSIQRLMNAA